MAKRKTKSMRCPTCRSLVRAKEDHFPFCSEHCRTIDLGKWASGAYKVCTPISDPDVLEDIASGVIPSDPDKRPS